MSYRQWRPYVPVAVRRRKVGRTLAKLVKGRSVSPVAIAGPAIARSFWGKSWCRNLERYSDFANRLPRGRTYVRNGSVVDLQIGRGRVSALVSGTRLYTVTITIAPVTAARWQAMCRDCAGSVDSLVELLQGRLAKGVMDRVCREGDGLFPSPREIKLSCSCPDWADMCKHVAAVLYGVGARLDEQPALLFALRGVEENDLIARAGEGMALGKDVLQTPKLLAEGDVAALFGLEMVEAAKSDAAPSERPRSGKRSRGSRAEGRSGAYAKDKPPRDKRRNARQRSQTGGPQTRQRASPDGSIGS
jgi:uncharacterized Zn finger protein